jgi:hypothetical protein
MKYYEFLILQSMATNAEEVISAANALSCPETLAGVAIPTDLNKCEIWQILALKSMQPESVYVKAAEILLGLESWQVENEEVEKVLGFGNWLAEQMKQAADLFKKCHVPPTPEEKAAGVEQLNFGDFGLLDWFAQRMHITHDAAEHTNWLIVWQCMYNDAQKTLYERRLMKVRSRKKK